MFLLDFGFFLQLLLWKAMRTLGTLCVFLTLVLLSVQAFPTHTPRERDGKPGSSASLRVCEHSTLAGVREVQGCGLLLMRSAMVSVRAGSDSCYAFVSFSRPRLSLSLAWRIVENCLQFII